MINDNKKKSNWPEEIHNNYWLNNIRDACSKYADNDSYVYKTCHNVLNTSKLFGLKREWMVILQKLKSTKTNEDRRIIDKDFAHYRANKLKVIEIFNISDPTITKKSITNVMVLIDKKCTYTVGSIVKADNYDDDIQERYTSGIYYFKTYQAAFYYGAIPTEFSGNIISTDENGFPISVCRYIKGKFTESIKGQELIKFRNK